MVQSLTVIEDRERPFSCGSQHADWESSNCDRCTKRIPDDADYTGFRCDIQKAIGEAFMTDGTVSKDIARRMGYTDHLAYNWPCTEVDWTPEWKAECVRRRTMKYRVSKMVWEIRRNIRKWIRDRRERLVRWYRFPIAERKALGPGTENECWADWVMWSMFEDHEKPCSGSERCRAESIEQGSCYCGRFTDGKFVDSEPR
jgi:hypothetical protein